MKRFHHTAMSILLCSSLLAGCAKEADITESSTDTAPTTTTEETTTSEETTTNATVDLPDEIDEQLQIIYDNYEIWMLQPAIPNYDMDEQSLQIANYAVTDLDGDGMLEIIKSGSAGTAHNSRNIIYEVTEEGTLELLNEDFATEWSSGPDLWSMDEFGYYTDENGTRWNLTSDCMSDGLYGCVYEYDRVSIDNGIVIEPVCYEEFVYYDFETESAVDLHLFYDAEHNEITEDEYYQITDEYNALVEGTSIFGWISPRVDGELTQPTLEQLAESYHTFMGL